MLLDFEYQVVREPQKVVVTVNFAPSVAVLFVDITVHL